MATTSPAGAAPRVRVRFEPTAVSPECRLGLLPRSGACAAPLPGWHAAQVVMLGGYTEEVEQQQPAAASSAGAGAGAGAQPSVVPAAAAAAAAPGAPAAPPPPRRAPTIEAWTYSGEGGGRWSRVQYAPGPVPQPRLTAQAAVVGDGLWLVGGWDPSAPPDPASPTAAFLNDVWRLDLRTWAWAQVEVVPVAGGEPLPRISRFAMAALPPPGGSSSSGSSSSGSSCGSLLIHTHRCGEAVMVLDCYDGGAGPGGQQPRATLRRVPVRGAAADPHSPPSRGLHSLTLAAAAPGSGSGPAALYVYGGAPQSGSMYGDLWRLDLDPSASGPGSGASGWSWQQLEAAGAAPHARCSHVAGAAAGSGSSSGSSSGGRYLVVAGGSYYSQPGRLQPLDDVAVYDTQTNAWLEMEVEGPPPSARNASVMAPLPPAVATGAGGAVAGGAAAGGAAGTNRFLLHGGWRPFVETYSDSYVVTVSEV
ncbi:hypothetical protein HXX76_011853 [Chlamydomonas incerta]|uniref:Uncharacterized protein n=1 Tax=Chlamydomonas incerta TaxID=51695 RepID=A0A835VW92_CHLIN|nr:hypothetical protein HXX76_011853 [Chlamydomonas incerta]|eukprot:KAG2428173.1 hypothetical protein HXX76_011853 [Chlamydomonas incerta]